MATLRTVYVDPDVSGGAGNGTSWANAYSSLNAAEQAQDDTGDLVARDEYIEFHCGHNGASQTTADTTAVNVEGWTTDATRYIRIYTETADRHDGKWHATKYRLEVSNDTAITVTENYARLEGLQAKSDGTISSVVRLIGANGSSSVYFSCGVVRAGGTSSAAGAILVSTGTAYIWNTVVYDLGTNGNSSCIVSGDAGAVMYIYSCTVRGNASSYGIRNAGTATCKNCYASAASGYSYSGTISKTTCASSDTTGSTGLQSIAYDTTEGAGHAGFTNVTAGSEDFTLKSGSVLVGAGTDTSGDSAPLNFTVDIIGTSRS